MSANTKIEWADHTFNPWFGCTKVSPGCDHCYAEARMDTRLHRVNWGPGQPRVRTQTWGDPEKWNKQHEAFFAEHGRRQRVFCASLADVFDNEVPAEWRADLFRLIRKTPNLDWLLLTKRIGNAHEMMVDAIEHELDMGVDPAFDNVPWPNVWIGATIVNQAEADRDIPKLLQVPAAKRFLSMEPLLGPVDLTRIHESGRTDGGGSWDSWESCLNGRRFDIWADGETDGWPKVDWVIVGGESGPGARPMHPDWARSLRDQCETAGVPFLFKQWGEWLPGENEVHPYADGRKVAHHQDGSWGKTDTKVNAHNYVTWDAAGEMRRGSLLDDTTGFCVHAWAERVGKKAAGRLLDGRTWDEVPT